MTNPTVPKGLSSEEALNRLKKFGRNELVPPKKEPFLLKLIHVLHEPMFLLLLTAAAIYFILGNPGDGAVMLIFVAGIMIIEAVQEWKTDRTLQALKDLSAPRITVIRDETEQEIASRDLVPGDVMLLQEGVKIPADGIILSCNDFCVDESSLTGESAGVWKSAFSEALPADSYWQKNKCYGGTLVTQGTAAVTVTETGAFAEYGKISSHIAAAPDEPTPLQRQIRKLVTCCAAIAAVLFVLVAVFTFFNLNGSIETGANAGNLLIRNKLIESALAGITLAMAMIPEEFPVILTVFLSMGAWRLARKKSLVRKLPSVETLGAASVLCVDKTGTITQNSMAIQELWSPSGNEEILCETMGLGCETEAYDPMEKAMIAHCESAGIPREHLFGGRLVAEYPFTHETKMMGHVWYHDGEFIIAAKGSPEKLMPLCSMTAREQEEADSRLTSMLERGLRVIAVGIYKPASEEEIPSELPLCPLTFLGFAGLSDPPRKGVKENIALCRQAGIRVIMITGDNGVTAASIARQIGMEPDATIITGELLDHMTDEELQNQVVSVTIFSRVIPEHKMRIVKALKENGEIVAMTGDGVNDAPALKYADIGIAMGGRGSEAAREAAREAAGLILMDDNFSTIVETVKDGRRIYDNIRKAVGYVFIIHIPIASASLLGPLMGIGPSSLLLLPLHVVLMELLIDPTCSIVLERQPAESGIMDRPPRNPKEPLLSINLLVKSILQGISLFAASFGLYAMELKVTQGNAAMARSMGISVLMLSNLFLVQVNSSDYDSIFRSLKLLAKDRVMWAVNIGTLLMLILILYSPLHGYLKLAPLSLPQLALTFAASSAAVFWYELVKLYKRRTGKDLK